ncbi:MAG: ADP-glyceromanno-heptose 6-epimerase [Candidatus Eremiobacteraeota bacterium]|nr:ADP-glyceromanno-heptose 6-epimerase [Candidatus Eremiobacteraeota bacterium]
MPDHLKKKIIVTGGAGFIGSALVWALNRRGLNDILIVDRLDSTEKWKNLVPLRYADYMDADDFLADVETFPKRFSGVSALFHLGACSSTTETDAAFLMRNNYEYTKSLARWAVKRGVRFVYASSAATYGPLEDTLSDGADLQSLRPLNAYAYSKQRFDLYASEHGLLEQITGIKYFNIFGPNERHKGNMRSLVDKAFAQIRSGGAVKLFRSERPEFRDGEQRRDFLYVKDAVEMTLHLAERDARGIYNAGSGVASTWLDLVRPIFHALEIPERIEFIDMPPELREKYQYFTCADIGKLRRSGFDRPLTPLSEAVDDYVRNYLVPNRGLDPHRDV